MRTPPHILKVLRTKFEELAKDHDLGALDIDEKGDFLDAKTRKSWFIYVSGATAAFADVTAVVDPAT